MVFTIRQLQEKAREQHVPLYVAFIDLEKAFDSVNREKLWLILERYGCPPKLKQIIAQFHESMVGRVSYNGSLSDPFPIQNGVKQGCVLAPTLFNIFVASVLSIALRNTPESCSIVYQFDGQLFNLQRLQARTKVSKALLRDLQYADDCGAVAHSAYDLQRLLDNLNPCVHPPRAEDQCWQN